MTTPLFPHNGPIRPPLQPAQRGLDAQDTPVNRQDQSVIVPASPEVQVDFIDAYAEYADILEAPREMHEAVALMVTAAVLNKNGVVIEHSANRYPLDFWLVLLSLSGFGRSTLVQLVYKILEESGLAGLVIGTHWGSPQAFYQQMADGSGGLFVWGELSEKLKLLHDARFGGVKEWLTDRYDALRTPDPISYRKTSKPENDTPTIEFNGAPRTNILATSSEAWFFDHLKWEDSAGGFLPRWLFVRAGAPTKLVPTPEKPDEKLACQLVEQLRKIDSIRGPANLSEILPQYDEWYRATKPRFERQADRQLAGAYFGRHRVHILKLAVVYEVSRSQSLIVTPASWARAVAKAQELENTIFSLLPTGMTCAGYAIAQMEERIRVAGSAGLPQSEFTRAFQHQNPRERQQMLETLLQAEKVVSFSRQSGGRPAKIFVHLDFADEYQQKLKRPCAPEVAA